MTPTATNFPMGVHPNSSEATASSGSSVVGLEVSSGAQNPISLFILTQPSRLKCASSSTPTDPQIDVSGSYATGTLTLGPLRVPDVPGLVLGPSCGLLGLKTRLDRLF